MFVAKRFTKEIISAILLYSHEIALGLGQKPAVALNSVGMGDDIVRRGNLRQFRGNRGKTVQGKTHKRNAGMGCVEFLVGLLNRKSLHRFHLPGEILMAGIIA